MGIVRNCEAVMRFFSLISPQQHLTTREAHCWLAVTLFEDITMHHSHCAHMVALVNCTVELLSHITDHYLPIVIIHRDITALVMSIVRPL